jgi:isopentenyldiphosphate isomerase
MSPFLFSQPGVLTAVRRIPTFAFAEVCVPGAFENRFREIPARCCAEGNQKLAIFQGETMGADEIFDVVDPEGRPVGRARRSEVHGNPALIHRAVHVLVFNPEGCLYLQKRSADKDIQPGKWDTSVGGHVGLGEAVEEAARREMREELGIETAGLAPLHTYLWRSPVETEFVTTYRCEYDGPVTVDPVEIDEGRFWTAREIEAALGSGLFTPNFEEEYSRIRHLLSGSSGSCR